ncbi:hypothetical protein GGR52DRAFT_547685 [Hypoxylon sp. FL1284]|nr:hypothetical protein GGR52DRAFT_547685 [Hypoxylon sp. FL1284]
MVPTNTERAWHLDMRALDVARLYYRRKIFSSSFLVCHGCACRPSDHVSVSHRIAIERDSPTSHFSRLVARKSPTQPNHLRRPPPFSFFQGERGQGTAGFRCNLASAVPGFVPTISTVSLAMRTYFFLSFPLQLSIVAFCSLAVLWDLTN